MPDHNAAIFVSTDINICACGKNARAASSAQLKGFLLEMFINLYVKPCLFTPTPRGGANELLYDIFTRYFSIFPNVKIYNTILFCALFLGNLVFDSFPISVIKGSFHYWFFWAQIKIALLMHLFFFTIKCISTYS